MRKIRETLYSVIPEQVSAKLVAVYRLFKIFTFFYIVLVGMWIMITRSIIIGVMFMFFKFGTFWLTAIFASSTVASSIE